MDPADPFAMDLARSGCCQEGAQAVHKSGVREVFYLYTIFFQICTNLFSDKRQHISSSVRISLLNL